MPDTQAPPSPTPSPALQSPPPPSVASVMAERAKAASKDSLQAFKMFATNPVGGLPDAYASLGEARALGVGIVFGVVFALCAAFCAYRHTNVLPAEVRDAMRQARDMARQLGVSNSDMPQANSSFGLLLKFLVCSLAAFAGMAAAALAARKILRAQGTFALDSFVSGASMLPLAAAAVVSGVLVGSQGVLGIVFVFGISFTILMLFSGFVRIAKLPERSASLVVPSVLLISGLCAYLASRALM